MNRNLQSSFVPSRPKMLFAALFILLVSIDLMGVESEVKAPFIDKDNFSVRNPIDSLILTKLRRSGIEPAELCSDAVFIRRVFLDVNGTLPDPQEVRSFLSDRRPNKRSLLIDKLLKRKEFTEYWTLKWCDLLRVKSEFPIKLWPNAVQAYSRWIHDAIKNNMPYDQFARELLTASGSNFRVPQVNFYRAVQERNPSEIAEAVALTFMGVRLDKWPAGRRSGLESFFSRIAYKKTAEWKEEIVYLDPKPAGTLRAVFPDGTAASISSDQDPRVVFADWLTKRNNPWFARNIVNRIWAWLLGRGIINEPDDIRPDNPPIYPRVLEYLEKELVESNYDLRHIYRLILNSHIYQQSSIPRSNTQDAESVFACYPVRRLDAEVLIDALCRISGTTESYSSLIPEPYTFIPPQQRTIELEDGSITSQFLEMFGRPPRDTGLESERNNQPSEAQALHLLNSSHIQNKLQRSWRLNRLIRTARGNKRMLINLLYLNILSRFPTSQEQIAAAKYFKASSLGLKQAANDLAWALINTKEFLYRH